MADDYEERTREQLVSILRRRDAEDATGTRLRYSGQRLPWQLVRQVRPRQQRIDVKLSVGDEDTAGQNLVMEGENLQAMVSLYRHRGQVDLILTDPPYNTGNDFRYNDRWDTDPNDPELGRVVPAEDGSRHAKWLRFMHPRVWMMKEMLRPGGVVAICIDHRELFRLGMLMDSVFEEPNRLGIINWQKSYAPRNDRKHVSTATEYVLVYAKREASAKTAALARTEEMNARYGSPDGDQRAWAPGDLSAPGATTHPTMVYAIQSPFTGLLQYPAIGSHWRSQKKRMKEWLEAWGSEYVERDIGDGNPKALVIKDCPLPNELMFDLQHPALKKARELAEKIRDSGPWPTAYWRDNGIGAFRMKKYLEEVRQGVVPTTFWSDENFDAPFDIGSTAWTHKESGHSQSGINELQSILGRNVDFETVKPLKLFRKIIQLWCPTDGLVLDPFAGTGTTGHAVLELNREEGASRRFLLVEQGRLEKGDPYAKTLTAERLRRAIDGTRVSRQGITAVTAEPLPGGFRFVRLTKQVDAKGVLALEREEMIDLLLTSHWESTERASAYLRRLPAGSHKHLFAVNGRREGFFLVWSGPDGVSNLGRSTFREVVEEAKNQGLTPPYHVYARTNTYGGAGIEFYQIPHKILEKLGFDEVTDAYLNESDAETSENTVQDAAE